MFDDSQALSPEDEPEDMDATAESESSNGSTPSTPTPSPNDENEQNAQAPAETEKSGEDADAKQIATAAQDAAMEQDTINKQEHAEEQEAKTEQEVAQEQETCATQDSIDEQEHAKEQDAVSEQDNQTSQDSGNDPDNRQSGGFVSRIRTATAPARTAWRSIITPVRTTWHAFTNLKAIRFIIDFFRSPDSLWNKRMRFSYAFYAIVFFILTSAEVIFLQWGMYSEPSYSKDEVVDDTTKALQSVAGQVTRFISQMWVEQKNVCLVSFVGLALIYLALVFVTNRFWIATLVFGVVITAFGVANSIKVQLRNEPIIPADLTFISGGDTGSIMSFVPESSQGFIDGAIKFVVWFAIIVLVLFVLSLIHI